MIAFDQQTLDRHQLQSPSSSAQPRHLMRASPVHSHFKSLTVTKSPVTLYAPYPVPNTPPIQRPSPAQRHFDPTGRASAPIEIHRPNQLHHRSHLSTETDTESLYVHSPGTFLPFSASPQLHAPTAPKLTRSGTLTGYPSLSVPAPSDGSSDTSEEELEENDYDGSEDGHHLDIPFNGPRDYSLRTPVHLPSSLPSPRVMHAPSSSIPTGGLPPISTIGVGIGPNGSFSPPTKPMPYPSPVRNPITLPTTTGGTYTFGPLPVILEPIPSRDSSWRWSHHNRVSSIRHTLSDKLYHKDPIRPTATPTSPTRSFDRADDESDEEDGVLSDALSTSPSPKVTSSRLGGGVLDTLNVLWTGGGKKQFFATPATYSDFSKPT